MAKTGRQVGSKDARGRPRVQTQIVDESLTVQSDAHLADINNIMSRFAAEGIRTLDEADFLFMDVSEFTDFQDLMNQNIEADRHFMALPSKVREIFDHSLAVYLDTAHDKDKRDALVQAGFLEPLEVAPTGSEEGSTGTSATSTGTTESTAEAE